jgi:ribonuclease E
MATKKSAEDKIEEHQAEKAADALLQDSALKGGSPDTPTTEGSGEDVKSEGETASPVARPRKRPARTKKPVDGQQEIDIPAEAGVEKPQRKRKPAAKKVDAVEIVSGDAPPAPVKRAPRKKKTEQASPSEIEIVHPPVAGEQEVALAEEKEPVKKPARKRPPRKKRPHKDQDALEPSSIIPAETDTAEHAEPQVAEVSEPQGNEEQQEHQESAPVSAEKKKSGTGRRSRRGKRSPRRDDARVSDSTENAAVSHREVAGQEQAREEYDSRSSTFSRHERFEEEGEADDFPTFEDEEDESLLSDEIPEPENIPKPVCKLLINAEEPEECRLALLEDGRLESIHVSTVNRTQTKNNIYKARIVAIEPNLQAAFVDYGTEKNGFLPFSEIHPEYYKQDLSKEVQKYIEAQNWKKLSITDVIEKGQEVLVQVVKEEVGKKGANMTTYLSLPGRCVVLMPGSDSSGISRKISGEERRSQLREALNSIDIPEGIGWIVRTASGDTTQEALARDVNYLLRLWDEIKKKGQELEGVGMVYEDQHSVLRFLREHFDPSIEEILVDDRTALEQVKAFVELLPPNQRTVKVRLHKGSRPIFNQYSIEDQIESIYQSKVNLPSGGSIVIDPTEALVAIDVNSGSTSKGKNFEASIFQANMEAATEFARQLRLRDLGGLIVVDFIDMRSKKNIREVERQVKLAMKRDKAKVDMSRISKFGLMQISRQKLGAPIEAGNYRICEHCKGRGMVRSVETLALFYLRRIQTGASRKNVVRVECHFPLDVAHYLLNNKRHELQDLENSYHAEIVIVAETSMKPADNEIIFHKAEKEAAAKNHA